MTTHSRTHSHGPGEKDHRHDVGEEQHHRPGDHTHPSEEHGHFHEEELEALARQGGEIDASATIAPNPGWFILNSVGIDIGSSTSHLAFSKLFLEQQGLSLSSRFVVVRRDILYRSPILLTPYRDIDTIDVDKLSVFIMQSYREAGLEPSIIHTGAVICTGEAVKKKNSEAITRMFSDTGGKFVCATAGPRLEGILAAHGSGAVARSRDGRTVLNIDVGGGSTKVTVARGGSILETEAINVGARLLAWDERGRLDRIELTGEKIASAVGIDVKRGMVLTDGQKNILAETFADLLFSYLRREKPSPVAQELLMTGPFTYEGHIDEIIFSGGVGQYIYSDDQQDYGDVGPLFAQAIRARAPSLGVPISEGTEAIRATVIGASQYTVQVSSSTIFISDPQILPLRDYQVVVPQFTVNHTTSVSVARSIHQALERFDLLEAEVGHPIALCIRWPFETSYPCLHMLALGIVEAMTAADRDQPWVLIFDRDIGGLVGAILKNEMQIQPKMVVVDEIDVSDLDFVDIGQELDKRHAVPVVVKSLVFE
jgi:ethanolamine utilization protein EutA